MMTSSYWKAVEVDARDSPTDCFYLTCDPVTGEVRRKALTHRKVHVSSSAKNNIYLINFGEEIGQSKSINLSENFRIA